MDSPDGQPEPQPAPDTDGEQELQVLDALESDLLAVESALTSLDELARADGTVGGEDLEDAIMAIVPPGRFGPRADPGTSPR